ncbi:putative RNA polymerase II subunit B1 CTD phosphatase RPAP2-like [Planoprotostelium fungivorum]|uniref:RNA polymerase II subunit B1 CTD phosphatase RPAP2 homolog n=1 Tax=Planoprotostelium fungivorum TaxID=1890364 RepID=A0A2P6NET8_9EUKA|nr:putative RNA polymerase II subunit B1 CTD phosphatase RPAP2-like [Planoprotostelium fungivorum]
MILVDTKGNTKHKAHPHALISLCLCEDLLVCAVWILVERQVSSWSQLSLKITRRAILLEGSTKSCFRSASSSHITSSLLAGREANAMDYLDEIVALDKQQKQLRQEARHNVLKTSTESVNHPHVTEKPGPKLAGGVNETRKRVKRASSSAKKSADKGISHAQLKAEIDARLEKEKETFKRQEKLIYQPSSSAAYLVDCASYLQKGHYDDVITERALARVCGYPTCSNEIKEATQSKQKYHISLSKKQVFTQEELELYCSEKCLVSSRFYAAQLSETPVYLRTGLVRVRLDENSGNGTNINEEVVVDNPGSLDMSKLQIIERSDDMMNISPMPVRAQNISNITQIEESEDHLMIEGVSISQKSNPAEKVRLQSPSSIKICEKEDEVDWTNTMKKSSPTELSLFGVLYMTFDQYITPSTRSFVNNHGKNEGDLAARFEQLNVDEAGKEEQPQEINSYTIDQRMKRESFYSMILLYLPMICEKLGLQMPAVQQDVIQLSATFSFKEQVDSFSATQWELILLPGKAEQSGGDKNEIHAGAESEERSTGTT